MPSPSAVLFDFGMVLSRPPRPESWAELVRLSGMACDNFQRAYWAHRDAYDSGHLNGRTYWNSVLGAEADRDISPELYAALVHQDVQLWTDLNLPLVEWVHRLHAAGIPTGILSNMPDAMAKGITAQLPWLVRFKHVIWSHSLRMRKPDPAIYHAAIAGMNVPASEILFLDDKLENIVAAEKQGINGILYTTQDDLVRELFQRGWTHLLHPESSGISDRDLPEFHVSKG